ncbi:MAG: nucleotidyltransferase family protein [Elusimicrobia bacterium]|nr:nucleotidyltransferase family protein [Elusimicrobiota bacterium]
MTQTAAANVYLTGARNAVLLRALEDVLSAAAKAGISVMPIKGALLCAVGVYQPGEREFCDLDLLVKAGDAQRFAALLPELGYERTRGGSNDFVMSGPEGVLCLPAIDIHTAPFEFAPDAGLAVSLLWESASEVFWGEVKFMSPSAEWLLLIALLNPLLHNGCLPGQAVNDARGIARHFAADWEAARVLALRLGLAAPFGAAMRRLELERVSGARAAGGVKERIFFAAARRSDPSRTLQYLLPAVLSPANLPRRIFPGREFFEARGEPFTLWRRLSRPLGLILGFLKSLTELRG